MAHSIKSASAQAEISTDRRKRSAYIRIRKSTLVAIVLLYAISIILSFSLGRFAAPQSTQSKAESVADAVNSDETIIAESEHTPKTAYEEGWKACMQCWGISSTEGMSFETATITISQDGEIETVVFGPGDKEVLLLSDYYSSIDMESARTIFGIGFRDCMKYWKISYAYSSREIDDDITYGFNSWYS